LGFYADAAPLALDSGIRWSGNDLDAHWIAARLRAGTGNSLKAKLHR